MAPIVSSIEIGRAPQVVFEYATDPARFPEWQSDVVRVRLDESTSRGVGLRFMTTRRIGPAKRTMTQEITQSDGPRRWAARTIGGPIILQASVLVEPIESGARSRVTFTFDFTGRGLGRLLTPMIRRMTAKQAPKSLQNLRQRLESDRTAP